jgi:hypothetical protein
LSGTTAAATAFFGATILVVGLATAFGAVLFYLTACLAGATILEVVAAGLATTAFWVTGAATTFGAGATLAVTLAATTGAGVGFTAAATTAGAGF